MSHYIAQFVLLCEFREQSPENVVWIKFMSLIQTVWVCSHSGSGAVPLFLCMCTYERNKKPSVHASTSSACVLLTVLHFAAVVYDCIRKNYWWKCLWICCDAAELEAVLRRLASLGLERHNNQMLMLLREATPPRTAGWKLPKFAFKLFSEQLEPRGDFWREGGGMIDQVNPHSCKEVKKTWPSGLPPELLKLNSSFWALEPLVICQRRMKVVLCRQKQPFKQSVIYCMYLCNLWCTEGSRGNFCLVCLEYLFQETFILNQSGFVHSLDF